jgi:hypothetical protein
MQNTFPEGPPFTINFTQKDNNGNLTDYSSVEFSYDINGTGPVTLTYSPGGSGYFVLQKASTGSYFVPVTTLGKSGTWQIEAVGFDASGNRMSEKSWVLYVKPRIPSSVIL